MIRALVIEPDGTREIRDVPTGYPAFNDAVLDGGYMQELYGRAPDGENVVFIFDEEGKFKRLEPNFLATALYHLLDNGAPLLPGDLLCGPVAVCGRTGENLADVPDSVPWT